MSLPERTAALPVGVALAVVMAGDVRSPAQASGTPYHLTRALEDLGVEVSVVRAQGPRSLRLLSAMPTLLRMRPRAWGRGFKQRLWVAENGPTPTRLRSAVANRRLAALSVDGVLQIGSEFLVSSTLPLATYEDRTIAQAIAYGEERWRQVPAPDRAWRVASQRTIYERATVCCTLSNWAARSIRDDYGIDVSKIRVVGAGANLTPRPSRRDWSRPSFLFVGRDWARKNGQLVVEAFCRLRAEVPHARLDLVGGHPPLEVDGVTGHGLLDLADARDREALERLFSQATCFVMPSSHEPLGLVYAEAGAAGIPSIAGPHGGSPEVVGDGGLIVDPQRPDELLDAMRQLCDPARAAALGAKAHEHSRLYTWRSVAERILVALGLGLPGRSPNPRFLNAAELGGDHLSSC